MHYLLRYGVIRKCMVAVCGDRPDDGYGAPAIALPPWAAETTPWSQRHLAVLDASVEMALADASSHSPFQIATLAASMATAGLGKLDGVPAKTALARMIIGITGARPLA